MLDLGFKFPWTQWVALSKSGLFTFSSISLKESLMRELTFSFWWLHATEEILKPPSYTQPKISPLNPEHPGFQPECSLDLIACFPDKFHHTDPQLWPPFAAWSQFFTPCVLIYICYLKNLHLETMGNGDKLQDIQYMALCALFTICFLRGGEC